MRGKVILKVVDGLGKGQEFTFTEHDVFIFGRDPDCHTKLPDDDLTASRHHFVLEVNPPDARLRDLGSLNGTYVNGKKFGGRPEWQSPEEGARSHSPEVDLHNGDRIRVGVTEFLVSIKETAICNGCGIEIPDAFKSVCRNDSGGFTCPQCSSRGSETLLAQDDEQVFESYEQYGLTGRREADNRELDWLRESYPDQSQSHPVEAVAAMLLRKYKEHRKPAGFAGNKDLPGYKIGKMLGRGGMGEVYLAERQADGAQVAVKIMLPKAAVDARARDAFLREIETTKNLHHSNLVRLFDYGSSGRGFYFVMELCTGGSIDDFTRARGGHLSLGETSRIVLQVLDALAYVHQQGFVHRDIKPQNIMLANGGLAKLGDLGLAKSFDKAGFSGMTLTGSAGGTPLYMPKEQVINFKYVKPVSDVWSIAATMYFLLTGHSPYEVNKGQSPLEAVLKAKIIPIEKELPDFPSSVASVVDRALSVRPEDRYPTAMEFLTALRGAL